MGMMAALVAAASGASLAGAYTLRPESYDDYGYDILPRRRRPDRKKGGHRGKRHDGRPRKRPNMNLVSKRVRRKHRRARRAA